MSADDAIAVRVEALDGHGRVQWRERLTLAAGCTRFTVGRAIDADVTLDDPYAAARHAAIEIGEDGVLRVSDLASVNGIVVAGKRRHGASGLVVPDGVVQVGRTKLRIRTSRDALAAEQPDQWRPVSKLRDPAWIAGLGALAVALDVIYGVWFTAPRDMTSMVVTLLLAVCIGTGVWVAFWSLLSRMLLGQWRWLRHAAILLGVAAVWTLLEGLFDVAWFAFSLPPWAAGAAWGSGILAALLLYLHLTQASNISARRAVAIACLLPLLAIGATYWVQDRTQTRNVNYIGSSLRLFPPELRLRPADTVDGLFADAKALRAAADEKRAATEKDSEEGDEFDEEE